jgi:hypothetical protein
MSVALASVDRQDRLADRLCARLDGMLAELAEAVAGCAELRDVGGVSCCLEGQAAELVTSV